jgi:uncharacterized protein involved in response to NO
MTPNAALVESMALDSSRQARFALFERGFRPFFLAAGSYAAVVVPTWLAIWLGAARAPSWLTPAWWHGHEMIFGFVAAAISGFLLTAVPVWTSRPALAGRSLAALVALWAAGRVAFLAAGVIPAWLVAAIDVLFLPALAAVLTRTLWGSGQYRNYAIVVVVSVLAFANAAIHGAALGLVSSLAAGRALRLCVDAVVVLMLVVGGRITPSFTANALRRSGSVELVHSYPWLDRLAIGASVLLGASDWLEPRSVWSGACAAIAGLAAGARLFGWRGWSVRADPLLWSLHLGMAWIALGLLLVAAGDLGAGVPATAGLHALTAGAMGTTILAVMTRVGLGHTGRPLVLPARAVAAYLLANAAALLRVAAAVTPATAQTPLLLGAGLAWTSAFGLFVVLYWPILTRSRSDGLPG